jgi:polyphosphate kinase
MIALLYRASQAGVNIRLIIRGICALVPGVSGISENIEAVSIVNKFLEHSRIFMFWNGGEPKYFISSADWMTRNLDRRVEVACPIYDKSIQQELQTHLDIQWQDNVKARILNGTLDNQYRQPDPSEPPIRAQEAIYEWLQRDYENRGKRKSNRIVMRNA